MTIASMEKEVVKKFVWVMKNISSLQFENLYSDPFVIGGCKWRLLAIAQGSKLEYLCLYLGLASSQSLPCGWRRCVHYRLSIVNQLSEELSVHKEINRWFGEKSPNWGSPSVLPFAKLHAKDGGFLVSGELMVVAEIDVLQVIGKLDVPVKESMDVNGFQVLPSQVESVMRIFERHPYIASKVYENNRYIQTANMNILLSLIKTMCQPPQELSHDDLNETSVALSYLENAGFELDWLLEKLNKVWENKNRVDSSEAQLQDMEEALHILEQRCSFQKRLIAFSEAMLPRLKAQLQNLKLESLEMEALMEKEKTQVLDAIIPFSFDDVV